MHSRVLGQHQHPVVLVDQHAFLGYQVHAVEDGVHDEHVEELVGRDGLGERVLYAKVYGLPVGVAVLEVDVGHESPDLLQVLDVLVHVLAAGLEQGEERHPTRQLGMVAKELAEGLEAAEDVLREVGAVHAQDEVLPPHVQQPVVGLGHPFGRGLGL